MTTPAPEPEIEYPRIVLMAVDSVDSSGPVNFGIGGQHPYASSMKVVAMYIRASVGGVEIYSFDGTKGVRDLVPMQRVRLIREEMSAGIFNEEIAHAEVGYPDDNDDDDDDLAPEPAPANGQSAS